VGGTVQPLLNPVMDGIRVISGLRRGIAHVGKIRFIHGEYVIPAYTCAQSVVMKITLSMFRKTE
jgi:hypothetical protein